MMLLGVFPAIIEVHMMLTTPVLSTICKHRALR